jgi:FkbM family methyltransferase
MKRLRVAAFSFLSMIGKPLARIGIGKIPFTSKLFSLINKQILPSGIVEINAAGHIMRIDTSHMGTGLLEKKENYEPSVTTLLRQITIKGAVVVDVGASAGYHTLVAAEHVGNEGKVFSFEPEPYSFEVLTHNIKINGYDNIHAVNKAVWDKNGRTRLFVPYGASLKSILTPTKEFMAGEYTEVETITLDSFFTNHRPPDIIKLDAEGAEPQIISGMVSIIRSNINLKIITEFNPRRLRFSGNSPEDYLDMLLKHGFNLYVLNDKGNLLEPLQETSAWMDPTNKGTYINIYCTRDDSKQIII